MNEHSCKNVSLIEHTHIPSHTQVVTVILSDRLRSSLLCHDVILVDPLLSYCTTAVVKTWYSACVFIFVCVRQKARAREAPTAGGVN